MASNPVFMSFDGQRSDEPQASGLPCGYTLYVHLQHRGHQCFLASLIALEHLCTKAPLPILRYSQLNVAYPRDQHPAVVTGPLSQSARCALSLARLLRFVHFRFQHLL